MYLKYISWYLTHSKCLIDGMLITILVSFQPYGKSSVSWVLAGIYNSNAYNYLEILFIQKTFIYAIVLNVADAIIPIPLHTHHFKACYPSFLLPAFAFVFLRTFSGCQNLFCQPVRRVGHATALMFLNQTNRS